MLIEAAKKTSGLMKTVNTHVGEAFSTGMGLGIGFILSQYMSQAFWPPKKTTKQIIICLWCRSKNAVENKFCMECGRPIYPPPAVQCLKCNASMPSSLKFCGMCGSRIKANKLRH